MNARTRRMLLTSAVVAGSLALAWWLRESERRGGPDLMPPTQQPSQPAAKAEIAVAEALHVERAAVPIAPQAEDVAAIPPPPVAQAGTAITGVVLSPAGTPLVNARVVHVRDDRGRALVVSDLTDAKGRFTLDVGVRGVRGDLVASAAWAEFSSVAKR